MLAVGREGIVLGAQRATGADLGGLLPEQAGPEAKLTLALQGGGLGVEAPDHDEVAIEPAQVLVGQCIDDLEVLMRRRGDSLTLGREDLDHVGPAVAETAPRRWVGDR